MYEVTIQCPEGPIVTKIDDIQQLQEVLDEHPNYTGVTAKRVEKQLVLKKEVTHEICSSRYGRNNM